MIKYIYIRMCKGILVWIYIAFLVLSIEACNHQSSNTNANIETLGHYLFFDTRLSLNNTKSCASCHNPAFAFTDGYRTSATALGENVLHNSPSLINVVYLKKFDWANSSISTLQQQIKRPLYSNHPIELGLDKHFIELTKRLATDSLYSTLFLAAYPSADSLFTLSQIEEALVAYVKTLTSFNANFDKGILTQSQQNGFGLFTNNQLNCSKCHPPPYFTLASLTKNIDSIYVNTGLYNVDNENGYPANDNGLRNITNKITDDGKFKIPSLRNVLLTAPYMHDGSVASIEEVIDNYANAGRNIVVGYHKSDGRLHKNKHALIKGFKISLKEKQELIDFLSSLTDSTLFYNPQFKNPFNK